MISAMSQYFIHRIIANHADQSVNSNLITVGII